MVKIGTIAVVHGFSYGLPVFADKSNISGIAEISASQHNKQGGGIGSAVMDYAGSCQFMIYFTAYVLVFNIKLQYFFNLFKIPVIQHGHSAPFSVSSKIPGISRAAADGLCPVPPPVGSGVSGYQRGPHPGGPHHKAPGVEQCPAIGFIPSFVRTLYPGCLFEEPGRKVMLSCNDLLRLFHCPAIQGYGPGRVPPRPGQHHIHPVRGP